MPKTLPRSRRRRANADLPDDLIHANIIPRLAIESIGRFRCVSKSWRSFLSTSEFVKNHLELHADGPKHIFLLKKFGCNVYSSDFSRFSSPDLTSFNREITYLGPSCHGLVLLRVTYRSSWQEETISLFILTNPITKESLELPEIPVKATRYGLGYDAVSDDYKVVAITDQGMFVDVYRVKMNMQRMVFGVHDLGYDLNYSSPGVYLGNYIYWTALSKANYILAAFDLAREKFEKVPLPSGISRTMEFRITVPDGCLTLVFRSLYAYDIWVMKEHGVQDSWTRLANIHWPKSVYLNATFRVECMLNKDEILVNHPFGRVLTYNWKNEYCSHMYPAADCLAALGLKSSGSVRTFVGSLVSPHF